MFDKNYLLPPYKCHETMYDVIIRIIFDLLKPCVIVKYNTEVGKTNLHSNVYLAITQVKK